MGCPYELTWGDYQDAKGIHIYDVDTNETEFIQNTLSPIHVKVSIEDLQNKNKEVIDKIKGNYVKFLINKKVDDVWLVKAQAKLDCMGALEMKPENSVIDELELKSGVELNLNNSGYPPTMMSEYFNNTEVDEGVEIDELNRRVSDIYQSSLR